MARIIYIQCICGITGREITKHTVIYGVHTYMILANPTVIYNVCVWF